MRFRGSSRQARPTFRAARALLVLFALAIQVFLIQPHVHGPRGQELGQELSVQTIGQPHGGAPPKPDPVKACPLCVAFATAGHALLLPAPANALPRVSAWLAQSAAPLTPASSPAIVSHIWQSRGPPALG